MCALSKYEGERAKSFRAFQEQAERKLQMRENDYCLIVSRKIVLLCVRNKYE